MKTLKAKDVRSKVVRAAWQDRDDALFMERVRAVHGGDCQDGGDGY